MTFDTLGLSAPILKAVARKGYNEPSPVQAQSIPAILAGSDILAAAQTGTGKTAGFTLPILENLSRGKPAKANQVRALILTPTRELAAQVAESVATYGENLSLRSAVVFGGVKINPQMMKLRKGADILIATPGRLLDLYQQNAIKFDRLEVLVLDEADRMLDMGFIHDIRRIIKVIPSKRQNLLFSATFSKDIRELAKSIVRKPVEISVSPSNSTAPKVKHWIYPVDKKRKALLLLKLIRDNDWSQVLVFTKTKRGANKLAQELETNGVLAMAIHGNKSQNQRTKALSEFKNKKINVLVATDIAARGIDIEQLPQVVNFDMPAVAEDYVHRIGRTGRASQEGQAVSLVCSDELGELISVQNLIQQLLTRESMEGFEPTQPLPETRLGQRPPKSKAKSKSKPQGRSRGKSQEKPKRKSRKPADDSKTQSTKKPKEKASQSTSGSGKTRRKKSKENDKSTVQSKATGKANAKTKAKPKTNPNAKSTTSKKRSKPNSSQSGDSQKNRAKTSTQKTTSNRSPRKKATAKKSSSIWNR